MRHSITIFLHRCFTVTSPQSTEVLKYRTEPTFRYLIASIRYFSVYQIPTSVSVSIFLNIGYRFGIFGIPTRDHLVAWYSIVTRAAACVQGPSGLAGPKGKRGDPGIMGEIGPMVSYDHCSRLYQLYSVLTLRSSSLQSFIIYLL